MLRAPCGCVTERKRQIVELVVIVLLVIAFVFFIWEAVMIGFGGVSV